MDRIFNFSAGPSMLPISVLERAASEMTNYNGSGMSVMEMSHRSAVYQQIIDQTEADLRKLMNIPENYKVLFLQGGATTQFSAVPLNLMTKNGKADYIVSGQFSGKAAKEAERYGEVRVLASSKDRNFAYVPYVTEFNKDSDYVHICYNNTIFGTVYPYVPQTGDIPLVADMSSGILSKPINVSDYGLIYAGAQKNMGPSGMTLVIVREDLIGDAQASCPVLMQKTARCTTRRPATRSTSQVWFTNGCFPSAVSPKCRRSTRRKRACCTTISITASCLPPPQTRSAVR